MSEILQSEPSPRQLRDELEELARRDLLGPAGGPEEIVAEQAVRGRYIVGLLAPRGQTAFPDAPEDLTEDTTELAVAGEDTEEGVADSVLPKAVSMLPSAIGLTFTVDGDAKAIQITARWGRYERIDNPDGDTPKRVWKRIPVEGVSPPIRLRQGRFGPWSPCPDYEDVTVQGIIRRRKEMWTITLYLVNGQFEQKQNKDEAWGFQPELIVESPDGVPIFLKRSRLREPANVELEDQAMQMGYRKQVEFAVGHGVAVHSELADGEWERAVRLTTRVIPSYEVPKTTPPTADDIPELADLICACESIRREAIESGDAKWGAEPFRIGLWIGQRSTPNRTEDSAEAIKQSRGQFSGNVGRLGTPSQLTFCPWCGSEIQAGKHLHVETYSQGRCRTITYCGDSLGRCLYSQKKSPGEGLPVLVVDEEVYRRLPSLLISTVDKFAQMPWKGETQMLFGRVDGYCERHGYRSPEIQDKDSHRKTSQFPAAKTLPAGPLRPPDLIIQDELHLISGPLGTLMGLYETAIERLASWEVNEQPVRPKVIASTATIRRADTQVHSLYLRKVNIFPPPGLDVEDNFFSRQREPTEEESGRLYLGICAPGTRVKTVLIRVYMAYMAAAQQLYEKYGNIVDPYLTLVGYFNAMRELGGMRRAVEDTIRMRLRKMDARGIAKRFIQHWDVEELTSRKSAGDIPKILDRLETPFGVEKKYPLDVLLATNMISVGVDVSRLGLMVVAGQPKTTSEYIQATSRVGRRYPGVVCAVYNWARPRDLSHYERFEHYHATLYQHVEPLSVTPFSPRARDRGLTGVLVSCIRLLGQEFNDNLGAGRVESAHAFMQTALDDISQRAMLVEGSQEIGAEVREELEARIDEWLARAQQVSDGGGRLGYKRADGGTTTNLLKAAESKGWTQFTCLNSLRDVEPSIGLILDNYGMDRVPNQTYSSTNEVADQDGEAS